MKFEAGDRVIQRRSPPYHGNQPYWGYVCGITPTGRVHVEWWGIFGFLGMLYFQGGRLTRVVSPRNIEWLSDAKARGDTEYYALNPKGRKDGWPND